MGKLLVIERNLKKKFLSIFCAESETAKQCMFSVTPCIYTYYIPSISFLYSVVHIMVYMQLQYECASVFV